MSDKKKVTDQDVKKALANLGAISKASDDDLDQPEGADLGNPEKNKMSDEAKSKKAQKAFGDEDDKEEEKKADGDDDQEKEEKAFGDEDDKEDEKKADEDEDKKDEDKKPDFDFKSKKSFAKSLPKEVKTKIEVSDFLKSLVDHTGESVDGLRGALAKSHKLTHGRLGELEDAVEAVAKSQQNIGVVLKAICEQIGVISKSAARPAKSTTQQVQKSADRSFKSALNEEGDEQPMFKSLSKDPIIAKSQISNVLCDLVKSGAAKDLDVINFETSGHVRPELLPQLQEKFN